MVFYASAHPNFALAIYVSRLDLLAFVEEQHGDSDHAISVALS